MSVSIYVCYHEPKAELLEAPGLVPLYLGSAPLPAGLNDQYGDHIHALNPRYAELCGLYWAWKNDRNSSYKGLCHYRRYFDLSRDTWFRLSAGPIHSAQKSANRFALDPTQLLKGYDIILPRAYTLKQSVYAEFVQYHHVQDLERLKRAIELTYPEYLPTYDAFFQGRRHHCFNMVLTRSEWFDRYCTWLFQVLAQFDELDPTTRSGYQTRIAGFLGERLLNVFVLHHNLRVLELPIFQIQKKRLYESPLVKQWLPSF